MNQLMKAWLGFGFASAVAATTVLGQANPLITVDELGNMTINGTPGPPGVLAVEPICRRSSQQSANPHCLPTRDWR